MKTKRLYFLSLLALLCFVSPRAKADGYAVNFPLDTLVSHATRALSSLTIKSGDLSRTVSVGQGLTRRLYLLDTEHHPSLLSGGTATVSFSYNDSWMHGYVYLDTDGDGAFLCTLNGDGIPAEGSELLSYSYVDGHNSMGQTAPTTALNPPAFRVPDLPAGLYRMRLKVDWNDPDPAGSVAEGNTIVKNGGAIVDLYANVHGATVPVTVSAQGGGTLLASDGTAGAALNALFGQDLTLRVQNPDNGGQFMYARVRHGYNLDGDSLVDGVRQWGEQVIPAFLLHGDELTIPASCVDGDVRIEAVFATAEPVSGSGDYALSFAPDAAKGASGNRIRSLQMKGTASALRTFSIPTAGNKVYADLKGMTLTLARGEEVSVSWQLLGAALNTYLYIDYNQDGVFSPGLDAQGVPYPGGELAAYNYYNGRNSAGEDLSAPGTTPKKNFLFTIPELLPDGVYRARLKVDDNSIRPDGSDSIVSIGGSVVDFLINVHGDSYPLELVTRCGNIYGANSNALPLTVTFGRSFVVVPSPAAEGFEAEHITVRHGHNIRGPQYIHGVRQWSEYTAPASGSHSVPSDSVDGEVQVTALFQDMGTGDYHLVWNEEFEGEDGSQPQEGKWMRCPRQNATWNRWLSDSEDVIFLSDGKLVARAIPNPETAPDNTDMLTGGVQTRGSFGFQYGLIEGRILTNGHTGNFPAFWLMPDDQTGGWPTCGEIDIWEQIDNQQRAYHTVHSHWTYDLGKTGSPTSSHNESCNTDRFHTFGFEWDERSLSWYMDGKWQFTYEKSTNADRLANGQWPFDKSFYIILNQSVGSGAWAAKPDLSHTYETLFDWVRVYQKEGQSVTSVSAPSHGESLKVRGLKGAITLYAPSETTVKIYDIEGVLHHTSKVRGGMTVSLPCGIYLVNRRKVVVY